VTSDALISLRNIGCCYQTRKSLFRSSKYEALRDVSLELHRGDTLGVIGRNGAGKTTLLRLMAGIIGPDRGCVSRQRNITVSMLTLQAGFDAELTGRSNVILGGLFLGFGRREILERMERIIGFADLDSFIDEPIKTYSTGMRARLGFALALELSPDVLLVDEVLGVGDTEFRKRAMSAMKEKMLSNQTIVFVSHDLNTVKQLCNQAIWIDKGVGKMQDVPVKVIEVYLQSAPGKASRQR
jgi:lipopolysaccharide transport system ATP-binding protein